MPFITVPSSYKHIVYATASLYEELMMFSYVSSKEIYSQTSQRYIVNIHMQHVQSIYRDSTIFDNITLYTFSIYIIILCKFYTNTHGLMCHNQ